MGNSIKGPTEARIYALAEWHGIVTERPPIDDWLDHVTRLSDDAE